jgi:lactate permease
MYQQVFDPANGSLALSAALASLPLLTLFVLLGGLRVKAPVAAGASLLVALLLAVFVWGMPAGQALLAASEGGFYGLFPILWILVNALWVYRFTEITGWDIALRRAFASVSSDQRVQAIIIAFGFGALVEALAGFGTPVAISAVMLIAIGLGPIKAASVALVANTAPVAFGSLAVPITTLATVTGLPVEDLGAMAGRQTPVLAVFVPLILVFMLDGRRGVRQTWPAAVLAGMVFAVVQFLTANYVAVEITDITASLACLGALLVFLRVWQPKNDGLPAIEGDGFSMRPGGVGPAAAHVATDPASTQREQVATAAPAATTLATEAPLTRREVAMAFAPYLVIITIFSLVQWAPIKEWLLMHGTTAFQWPGLDVRDAQGNVVGAVTFKLVHLGAAGTLLLASGLITAAIYRLSPRRLVDAYGETLSKLRWTIVTVTAVLALSSVMNLSGQTGSLGLALAQAGAAFAFLSPVVGWIGVAVTGSDTSSNSLFGGLQVAAAGKTGLDPVLLSAANSSGGVLGKMISPQNLAVAAAAIGLPGSEAEIFRKVVGWSIVLLVLFAFFVLLQSTPVLGWMVP